MTHPFDSATTDDLHPIDVVESLAERHAWEFDRVADNQIAVALEGQWRTFSIMLAWSSIDDTLQLILTFEFGPDQERFDELHKLLNLINNNFWVGAFVFWKDQQLMTYRYGLVLAPGQLPEPDQVDQLIGTAVGTADRYYPAFQLLAWGDRTAEEALPVAIARAYGRA